MSYFLEPYSHNKNKVKVKLDLSNYEIKSNLKGVAGINTKDFIKKTDLAKLETTPTERKIFQKAKRFSEK